MVSDKQPLCRDRAQYQIAAMKLHQVLLLITVAVAMFSIIPQARADTVPGQVSQATQAAIKPPITGLIAMGPVGFNPALNDNAAFGGIPGNGLADVIAKRNAFDGVVINIPWKQIQPASSGEMNTAPIDRALERIRIYNSDPLTKVPLRAILRVWAGVDAPDWVMNLDGGPVTVILPGPGGIRGPQNIAHFWSSHYQEAWRNLQNALAQRYDAEPLIAEISNTSCTSADDEWPALSWVGSRKLGVSSIDNLRAAGFTDGAFKTCLMKSSLDYSGWKTTSVNLIMGTFRPIDPIGGYAIPLKDYGFPEKLIVMWKSSLGKRAIFANHVLNYPPDRNMVPIYAAMKNAGAPLEFQTHSPAQLDWANSVKETVCLGGHALEIWNATNKGGFDDIPLNTLLDWSGELKNTATNDLCPILAQAYAW